MKNQGSCYHDLLILFTLGFQTEVNTSYCYLSYRSRRQESTVE